ncbi:hypothetical protein ACQ4LE_008276 [Meloidogyne hapla]|uniref:G domain-containing protein n=2 Tax=Meloidogyne hapla TaxID=6305 RepID=A0A1I8BIQ7_MELHA
MSLKNNFLRQFIYSFNINYKKIHNGQQISSSEQFENFVPRQRFELPVKFDRKDWYPKHMRIQMQVMEGKLRTVDLILEVHDSRVALTGRNSNFAQKLFSVRPHILVMNKKDLIDEERYREPVEKYYNYQGVQNVFWTDCTKRVDSQWDTLREKMLELLHKEHRFNRTVKTEYQIMVIGIPNVGKSSLINAFRKNNLGYEKAHAEGPFPGVTTRVQNRVRIWDRPAIYILDTPGVLNPWVHTVEEAMKLSVCNLILESQTSPYYVADYLLYYMNKHKDFSYLNQLKMEEPNDDIRQTLIQCCKAFNLRVKSSLFQTSSGFGSNTNKDLWDVFGASTHFLKLFRDGRFNDNFVDRDLLGFYDSSACLNPSKKAKKMKKCD